MSVGAFSRELYPEETIVGPDSSYGLILLRDMSFNDYRKSIFFVNGKIVTSPKKGSMHCELSNGRNKKENISLEKGNKFVVDNSFGYSWEGALALRIWRQYWLMRDNDDVQLFSCVGNGTGDINYKRIKQTVGNYLKLTRN